jgi:hypothetical protein
LSLNRLSTQLPVLIVGPPRSGSTWVEQVLGLTRGAYAIHEPDNEASDPFAFRAKLALGLYPVLGADDEAPPRYLDLWEHALTGQVHWGDPRWLAAKALLKQSRPAVKASFRAQRPISSKLRVAGALASPPSHRHKARQIIVKSVHAPLAVEWIARQRPLKVVVTRRNPYNIVASYTQLGWSDAGLDTHPVLRNGLGGYSWVPRLEPGASTIARVAWQIGLFTAALDVAASRNPDWQVVSHEELCKAPESGFRALCVGLGLSWTQEASDFLAASNRPGQGLVTNRVAAEQPERWRSRLTPEQADEIAEVLARFPVSTRTSEVPA